MFNMSCKTDCSGEEAVNEKCLSTLEGYDPEGRPFFFPCHNGINHHGNHAYHGGKSERFSFTIVWSDFNKDCPGKETA